MGLEAKISRRRAHTHKYSHTSTFTHTLPVLSDVQAAEAFSGSQVMINLVFGH